MMAEELFGDDQVECSIAEELETLVVVIGAERRMREREVDPLRIGEDVGQDERRTECGIHGD